MPRWIKLTFKIIGAIAAVILLLVLGAMLYITYNKAKVLKLVNTELNKNLDGTVTVGDMRPQFFKGFPNISLALKNVQIRDRRFAEHHHTLLDAKDFAISLNAEAFLKGSISINHVDISNATIDLYTDSTGYSNSSVFKIGLKNKNNNSDKSSSSAELEKFSFTNVGFSVEDQKARKRFNFIINDVNGRMAYPDSGWKAKFHLDVTAKSMAFNTQKGSFIKGQALEGDFTAGYNETTGKINVAADELNIGDDPFKVNAVFDVGKSPASFSIHVACKQLLWKSASTLLAANIKQKLDQFDIDKPIAVTAEISGSFKGGGDPFLYVTALVKDSKVTTPGGTINNCSFNGVFTNNYQKGKGLSDDNSVIRFTRLSGIFNHLPFIIDTGSIINLNKPIATGNFKANFPAADINYLLDYNIARFTGGSADVDLRFKTDIVNYLINKPAISGSINLKHVDINYIPDNLLLKNTAVSLSFKGNDLLINNLRLQTGRSLVVMNGAVSNFLNLYYSAPEKMLLTWQISSPQFYLGEFLTFLSGGNRKAKASAKTKDNNVIDQMSSALEKGSIKMHLDIANLHFNKFLATDTHADLLTTSNGVTIKNVGLKHSGGFLKLSGSLKKGDDLNQLTLKTTISHVDVEEFFYSFDNFGLKDFTSDNLRGFLSAKTDITAGVTDQGSIVPNSVNGTLDVNLQQGALVNFKPILGVAKFAFPFRNLKNISLSDLNARFDVHGDQITIYPMKISSSALNMDVAGVYGLSKGTNIAIDVPLRNPKNDTTIHDEQKLLKKRYKGIVLHILAKADSTGKIKIGWNKDRKKDD